MGIAPIVITGRLPVPERGGFFDFFQRPGHLGCAAARSELGSLRSKTLGAKHAKVLFSRAKSLSCQNTTVARQLRHRWLTGTG